MPLRFTETRGWRGWVEFTKQTPRSSNPSSLYHRAIAIKLQSQHLFINISIPQLQDTLLQKEEELARLQEENNNLRQYLNSALIKCLEEKAKVLCSNLLYRHVQKKWAKQVHAIKISGKSKSVDNLQCEIYLTSQSYQITGHWPEVTISPRNDILSGSDCGDSIAHGIIQFN